MTLDFLVLGSLLYEEEKKGKQRRRKSL